MRTWTAIRRSSAWYPHPLNPASCTASEHIDLYGHGHGLVLVQVWIRLLTAQEWWDNACDWACVRIVCNGNDDEWK